MRASLFITIIFLLCIPKNVLSMEDDSGFRKKNDSFSDSIPGPHVFPPMNLWEEDGECSICVDKQNMGYDKKYVTHCGHPFCFGCLSDWVDHNKTCPLCREKLTSENEHELVDESLPEQLMDQSVGLCIPIGLYCRLGYFKIIHYLYMMRGH